jgi:hypothetical protein
MTDFNATVKKIRRLMVLQEMQDNSTYLRNWLAFNRIIHAEKLKIGAI